MIKMNRKLIIGSVLAVFMLVAVSYTSAIDTNTIKNAGSFSEREVDKQQNPAGDPPRNGFIYCRFNQIHRDNIHMEDAGLGFLRSKNCEWSTDDDSSLDVLSVNFFYRRSNLEDAVLRVDHFFGVTYVLVPNPMSYRQDYTIRGFGRGISLTQNN